MGEWQVRKGDNRGNVGQTQSELSNANFKIPRRTPLTQGPFGSQALTAPCQEKTIPKLSNGCIGVGRSRS